jgi:hypothetical protein
VADRFFGGRERIRRLDRHMLRAGRDQRQELTLDRGGGALIAAGLLSLVI